MRTFYPRNAIQIPASKPHPDGTVYRISIGDEEWDGGVFHSVIKVQMMYNGKVAGRKSPSYPVGTDDYKRVSEAIQQLIDNNQ